MSSPRGRRVGRPTAGANAGERVVDYPQLSVRVPPDVKGQVEALSSVRGVAQWRVITEAITCYFRDLPAAEQAKVKRLVADKRRAGNRP